jgi:hypothetical protein
MGQQAQTTKSPKLVPFGLLGFRPAITSIPNLEGPEDEIPYQIRVQSKHLTEFRSEQGDQRRRTPPPIPTYSERAAGRQALRAMAASGSGGEPGRPWTATSTWAPAGGAAVEDAVSFDTTAVDAEASPSGVVLARRPSDGGEDPTTCEVTCESSFFSSEEFRGLIANCSVSVFHVADGVQMHELLEFLCCGSQRMGG